MPTTPGQSARANPVPPGKSRGKAKGDVGTQIGFQLRNLYDDVLSQPVPDRFLDLLSQLETSPGFVPEGLIVSEGPPAAASAKMKADLIAVIPNLRAFAVSLCGNPDRADDLVQETLVKAWSNLGSFVEGTNLPAWLFTILRNIYYSEYRKRRREVADSDGTIAAKLATAPAQNGHMDLLDFRVALQQLPTDQREALILIGASGLSYEEAAGVCNCAVGTMKSRVNRARNQARRAAADFFELRIRAGFRLAHEPRSDARGPALLAHRQRLSGAEAAAGATLACRPYVA